MLPFERPNGEAVDVLSFVPAAILPIVLGIVVFVSVLKFGFFLDKHISVEFRKTLAQLMDKTTDREYWPYLFIQLFDNYFDPRRRRRPEVIRSSIASLSVFGILFLVWLVSSRFEVAYETVMHMDSTWNEEEIEKETGISLNTLWALNVLALFVIVVVVNLVGDYFSLWESRIIVGRMVDTGGFLHRAAFLLLDLLATIIIYSVALTSGAVLVLSSLYIFFQYPSFSAWEVVLSVWGGVLRIYTELILGGLVFSHSNPINDLYSVCFYTTLFTSIWVWAFSIGLVLFRALVILAAVFDARQNPIGTAMTIGGAILGMLITGVSYATMLVS